MQKTKYPKDRTWIKDFRSFWNVAKFYSYSRHGNQCQRSRQASPLKSVGRDLKTENPPPFFSAGWLQRGNFWSLVNGSPSLSSWWMTLTYWSCRPSPAGQPATPDGRAEQAGSRARAGRAMSEEVSRCHSWGLTNTIRMKSVTFGKLITPEFRAMNGIHQLQPLLPWITGPLEGTETQGGSRIFLGIVYPPNNQPNWTSKLKLCFLNQNQTEPNM